MPRYSFTVCAHCEKSVLLGAIRYVHNPQHFHFYHSTQVEKAEQARQKEIDDQLRLSETVEQETDELESSEKESKVVSTHPIKFELSNETKYDILEVTSNLYKRTLNISLIEGVRQTCVYIYTILDPAEKARLLSYAARGISKCSDFEKTHVGISMLDMLNEYFAIFSSSLPNNIWEIISISFSAIGLLAALKGIVNIAWYTPPALPSCSNCSQPDVEGPGCVPYCESCGICENSNDWHDGSQRKYCSKICGNCDLVCADTYNDSNNNYIEMTDEYALENEDSENEANLDHVGAHEISSHKNLLTQLQRTFKISLVSSYMLLLIGILLSFVPDIDGDYLRMVILACSIGFNIGLRFLTKSAVVIKCNTCDTEDDMQSFNFEDSCQTWSGCCRAQVDEPETKTEDCLEYERQRELEKNNSVFESDVEVDDANIEENQND